MLSLRLFLAGRRFILRVRKGLFCLKDPLFFNLLTKSGYSWSSSGAVRPGVLRGWYREAWYREGVYLPGYREGIYTRVVYTRVV